MAWVENEPWELEQGIDGVKIFHLFTDAAQTVPWSFVGFDVNATISDDKGRNVIPITVNADTEQGTIRLIFPETQVNLLKVGGAYRYDVLLIPLDLLPANDHFLATGPVTVALRTTRRDP